MICEDQVQQVRIGQLNPVPNAEFVIQNGHKIALEWTDCHLGGKRPWFLCPACGRRCGVMYPYACRTCNGLGYKSWVEGKADRALRKAIRHREKFGQTAGGIAVPFPDKPKGMHWATYMAGYAEGQMLDSEALRLFRFRR